MLQTPPPPPTDHLLGHPGEEVGSLQGIRQRRRGQGGEHLRRGRRLHAQGQRVLRPRARHPARHRGHDGDGRVLDAGARAVRNPGEGRVEAGAGRDECGGVLRATWGGGGDYIRYHEWSGKKKSDARQSERTNTVL